MRTKRFAIQFWLTAILLSVLAILLISYERRPNLSAEVESPARTTVQVPPLLTNLPSEVIHIRGPDRYFISGEDGVRVEVPRSVFESRPNRDFGFGQNLYFRNLPELPNANAGEDDFPGPVNCLINVDVDL